jgi:predicted anti-sigma-YlaC factor YlaD
MTCRDVIEFLADYLNGELTQEERDLFRKHLGVCPPCIAYLQTYEQTIILSKSAMEASDDLPPVPEELIRAILASQPSSGQSPG